MEFPTLESLAIKLNLSKFLWALVLLLVCLVSIKYLVRLTKKLLNKTSMDHSLKNIFAGIVQFTLYFVALTMVTGVLGIPPTSLITVFGTLGLAFSLAMQDSLANIAGGMLLLYTKPFVSGDYIEADGVQGTVEKIGFIHTSIFTIDNRKIYIPNGKLSKDKILNYSAEDCRQLEILFPVSYTVDTTAAKKIIEDIVLSNQYVLVEKGIFIRVWALNASAVDIIMRVWTARTDMIECKCQLLEGVKHAFDAQNIPIPYNQVDVHIQNFHKLENGNH